MSLPFFGGGCEFAPQSLAGVPFVAFASGTFSRSSAGTYLTSASTIASAPNNVLRYENRGDGYGDVALFEPAGTNLCTYSHQLASWSQNANNNGYSNQATSPDGTANAGEVIKDATPFTGPYIAANIGGTKAGCISMWAKNNGGGTSTRLRFSFSSGIALPVTLTNTWTRYDAYSTFTGSASENFSFDHRANIPNTGDPAISVATDFYVYGVQLEAVNKFPSTLIINNTGASGTRSADVLTFTTAQYLSALRSAPFTYRFYPRFAHTDTTAGDAYWHYSFGGSSDGIYVDSTGGNCTVIVKAGGAIKAQSSTLTFSRHQQIALTVRPGLGQLTVAGATTGNGTVTGSAFTFANAPLRVGGIYGASNEACARITPAVGV